MFLISFKVYCQPCGVHNRNCNFLQGPKEKSGLGIITRLMVIMFDYIVGHQT